MDTKIKCNNLPLVSCIITTYNQKNFVAEAINSVITQTYKNIEIIIIDDCSTDNTKTIINSFNDLRIKKKFHNKNIGFPSVPRNEGIRLAQGSFIAFLDGDDYWLPNKIETQVNCILNDDSISGVGTNAYLIGTKRKLKREDLSDNILLGLDNLEELKSNILSSLFIRNEGIFFNESEDYKFSEDFEFNIRLVVETGKKIKLLKEPLVYRRHHPSNNVAVFNNAKTSLNVLALYDKILSINSKRSIYFKTYKNLAALSLFSYPNESFSLYQNSIKYAEKNEKIKLLPFLFLSKILSIFFS